MSRVRLSLAAALLVLAAYVGLRAHLRPDPYATLARPAVLAPPRSAAPSAPARPPSVPSSSASPSAAPPSSAALRATLRALDRARAAGFADPVGADPDAWAARSCACRAEDVRRLRDLAARGLALRGHRAELLRVELVRAGPASARVAVTDRLGGYAAVDARGRTVARWPASPERRWLVTLVRVDGRWLLGAVARAP
ncbi:MAG TPA: hypothetical protein VNA20_07455 [Frankiaceae bacterium]|nr:hypothetical protein [Frankiaceae bacterium]